MRQGLRHVQLHSSWVSCKHNVIDLVTQTLFHWANIKGFDTYDKAAAYHRLTSTPVLFTVHAPFVALHLVARFFPSPTPTSACTLTAYAPAHPVLLLLDQIMSGTMSLVPFIQALFAPYQVPMPAQPANPCNSTLSQALVPAPYSVPTMAPQHATTKHIPIQSFPVSTPAPYATMPPNPPPPAPPPGFLP
eukprot:2429455-Ditylum_brightwellii.AAC.1